MVGFPAPASKSQISEMGERKPCKALIHYIVFCVIGHYWGGGIKCMAAVFCCSNVSAVTSSSSFKSKFSKL